MTHQQARELIAQRIREVVYAKERETPTVQLVARAARVSHGTAKKLLEGDRLPKSREFREVLRRLWPDDPGPRSELARYYTIYELREDPAGTDQPHELVSEALAARTRRAEILESLVSTAHEIPEANAADFQIMTEILARNVGKDMTEKIKLSSELRDAIRQGRCLLKAPRPPGEQPGFHETYFHELYSAKRMVVNVTVALNDHAPLAEFHRHPEDCQWSLCLSGKIEVVTRPDEMPELERFCSLLPGHGVLIPPKLVHRAVGLVAGSTQVAICVDINNKVLGQELARRSRETPPIAVHWHERPRVPSQLPGPS